MSQYLTPVEQKTLDEVSEQFRLLATSMGHHLENKKQLSEVIEEQHQILKRLSPNSAEYRRVLKDLTGLYLFYLAHTDS